MYIISYEVTRLTEQFARGSMLIEQLLQLSSACRMIAFISAFVKVSGGLIVMIGLPITIEEPKESPLFRQSVLLH